MLKFCFSADAPGHTWQSRNAGWCCGNSFIEPFDHIALEKFAFSHGEEMTFIIRERLNGYCAHTISPEVVHDEQAFAATMKEIDEWPLHYMIVRVHQSRDGVKVNIKNGAWPVAPVFLTVSEDRFLGNWDPAALYPFLSGKQPDETRLAGFLAGFETPYAARTLFREMFMLTERASATWQCRRGKHAGIKIKYPKAVLSPEKRVLKPGADVLGAFEEILKQSVNRWLNDGVQVMAELSSGLDSGTIAAICASLHHEAVHTCGIIVPGEMGRLQQERRREMIDLFGYIDHSIEAATFPPLSAGSRRISQQFIVPWEECYYEAMDELLQQDTIPGRTVLFTGVGGDELFFPHWDELSEAEQADRLRPRTMEELNIPAYIHPQVTHTWLNNQSVADKAPRSIIPTSAIEASAYGSARYLRRGIWPVDPFCTPELVWFCRSLPQEWRNNRMPERKFLAGKGCSEQVTFPQSTETFTPFMEQSLRYHSCTAIQQAMQQSRLHRSGHIDAARYLDMYQSYCNGTEMKGMDVFFYSTAIAEMTLQCAEAKTHSNHFSGYN